MHRRQPLAISTSQRTSAIQLTCSDVNYCALGKTTLRICIWFALMTLGEIDSLCKQQNGVTCLLNICNADDLMKQSAIEQIYVVRN